MLTQEISLKVLRGNKISENLEIINMKILFFVSSLAISFSKLGRSSSTHITGISEYGVCYGQSINDLKLSDMFCTHQTSSRFAASERVM